MKTGISNLFIMLALLVGINQAAAQGTTTSIFPIATNPAVIAYSDGIVFDGILFDETRFALVGTLGTLGINGEVFGAFIPATPPTPAPNGSLVGSNFPLLLTGTPGINYTVQVSTNLALTNWTALVTNSLTNGTFSFTDTHATNQSRFYRAVKQ